MVNNWLNTILITIGQPCLVCGLQHKNPGYACQPCLDSLPQNQHSCSRCANPLFEANHQGLCGKCLKKQPAFDLVISPYLYLDPLRLAVSRFKFHSDLVQGRFLSQLLEQRLQKNPGHTPDSLIPVPLHSSRLRQRGFNQSLEIANYLGKQLNIKVDRHSCQRTRQTKPQSELSEKLRSKNLRGAFEIKLKRTYRHVAIVDDVMTSGATVNELAKALKKAGVEKVDVWSVCRAVQH